MTIWDAEKKLKEVWGSGPSVEIRISYAYDGVLECVISPYGGVYFRNQGSTLPEAVKGAVERYERWQKDEKEKPEEDCITLESCFRGED